MARYSPQVPQIGDFVLHRSGVFYGEVIAYGERQAETRRCLSLKVGLKSVLAQSRFIVMEDFASNWLTRSTTEPDSN